MTTKHIENDYTISFYSSSMGEYITTYPSSSVSQSVTTQTITQSVLNNYSWLEGTGSLYTEWGIVSGTSEIGTVNPNNSDATMSTAVIGHRNEIRGDEIFTNMYGSHNSERNRGIVIYKSSSSGFILHDYINIPTSSVAHSTSRTYLAREFSLDGDHLIVPIEKANSDSVSGELQIYKSSSSGWSLETTLTTASYNSAAPVNAEDDSYLAYWNSIIKNDLIFAGGFAKAFTSFPANNHSPDRYVGLFRSSSSGWEYEDQVQISGFDGDDEPGNNNETGGRIGNTRLNFDFDGATGVIGSKHANGDASGYLNDDGDDSSGRIHVIKSGSSGWYRDAVLGLESLNLTGNVDTSHNIPTASGGETYPDWYIYERFGLQSCAVSGNYIAATGLSKGFSAPGSVYHWRKSSVFILNSSSVGWAIEAQLEDPDPFFEKSGSYGGENDSGFGYGLTFGFNSLIVGSPTWRPNRSGDPGLISGRSYIYHSSSESGWSLAQTVDNPYSGSVFHTIYSERNESFAGNANPGASGAPHFGAKPAVSGSLIAIPAPEFDRHPDPGGALSVGSGSEEVNVSAIHGAVIILSGSENLVDVTSEQEVTESVETTEVVSSPGGPVPFRFSSRGVKNIRMQDSTGSYKTFIGEQKT